MLSKVKSSNYIGVISQLPNQHYLHYERILDIQGDRIITFVNSAIFFFFYLGFEFRSFCHCISNSPSAATARPPAVSSLSSLRSPTPLHSHSWMQNVPDLQWDLGLDGLGLDGLGGRGGLSHIDYGLISTMTLPTTRRGNMQSINLLALKLWICIGK